MCVETGRKQESACAPRDRKEKDVVDPLQQSWGHLLGLVCHGPKEVACLQGACRRDPGDVEEAEETHFEDRFRAAANGARTVVVRSLPCYGA